jgi:HEAT repeat protein
VASFLEANARATFPTNSHRFAMEALGRWKDVRGVPALLRYLNHGFMNQDAAKALKAIGPAAAKDVLKAANHPDGNMAGRVRALLKEFDVREDDLLAQCVEDLKAAETGRRRHAAEWLSQQKPTSDDKRPRVAKALVPLLTDSDANVQDIALNATKAWLHRESVPGLIALVENKAQGGRQRAQRSRAMEMLAELKDERAAPVMTRMLSVTFERGVAGQALRKMGPAAEEAVLACLSSKDNNVRSEACRILQDIGTAKSLPSLEPLATDRDPVVSFSAKQAVNAIRQRNK